MTDLILARKDPNKGYFGRQLWLPKAHVNTRSVKAGLEFPVMGKTGLEYIQLWSDAGEHLVVPREYIPRNEFSFLPFPVISLCPTEYPKVKITSRVVLDYKEPEKTTQRDAFAAMQKALSGLLNLSCGKGKTCLALHHMSHQRHPCLVIVNNTTLIDQWSDRIKEFLEVEGGVGIIQGKPEKWDWRGRGIVLAMIHTLSLRWEEMPPGMDRYFGTVYYDEVHHVSAPLFVNTAPLFYGERHGLTATANREDGLEAIYQYHIGQIYHRDLTQDLVPRIYFQQHPVQLRWASPEVQEAVCDKRGQPNIPKLRSYLGTLPECNDFIAELINRTLASGRKVLALSHSVDQLRALNEMFSDSGLCTGREKPRDRIDTLRSKQLTFGTLQLVKEALDEATLDTLFFLTPFGSGTIDDGGVNTLQQGMGRIQRFHPGKKTPLVFIIDYIYIPKFHRMCTRLKKQLHRWADEQGGPLEFKILRPQAKGDTK